MYWETFGFKEPPFALTPNPAFLFLSSPHQEALAHLLFAIENRIGFIELSGEVGTGKTTLVRTLLNQLDPDTHRTALIFNPTLSPLGLLREVNQEFGLACDGMDMRDLHQSLNRFLLEENRQGRTVVLVIDEAQNLSIEVLEQIRLISNLETECDKLIQIVLVGQPELNCQLSRPELRQLEQRITVRYHLEPMCYADTCEYIRHRIRFAGAGREPLTFSPGALKEIFKFSGGLPRLINAICDRALLLAYTRECAEVSASMAANAIADLSRETPRRRIARIPAIAAAALGIALVGAAAFVTGNHQHPDAVPQGAAAKAASVPIPAAAKAAPVPTPVAAKSAPAAFSRELALRELAEMPEQENLVTATNAVLEAWQVVPVQPAAGQPASLQRLARERGLTATTITGTFDALARLDAPALIEVAIPGGTRLVALTGFGKDGVTVTPAVLGRTTMAPAELAGIWSGKATLLWKDFHSLLASGTAKERGAKVKLLQGMLKAAACYDGPLNGRTGPKTQAALAAFQRREQLPPDGQPTPATLMLLYRRSGGFFPPSLSRQGSAAPNSRS
jgi:general secretion pathway protein A